MKSLFTFLSVLIINVCNAQFDCDSWVNLQSRFSAITVGDLDVTGDQITVEASFNATDPGVNIVSKHWGGFDVNYLLRPVRAEITTTGSGFVVTNQGASLCNDALEYNKTYHVAMVYDGSSLKFYRNGALISQVAAHGDLITNNWNTAIGEHAPVVTPTVNGTPNQYYHDSDIAQGFYDESFRGFINEVRIWNVARTEGEIRRYMNDSLPDPVNQPGLLGYWVFNDLKNRQGNAAFDGLIEGGAVINQTNTSCTFTADSCGVVLPVKLTDFSAKLMSNGKVNLFWNTEDELNISKYLVQRSGPNSSANFQTIKAVTPIGSHSQNNYSIVDENFFDGGTYYYRLLVDEKTGKETFSSIRSIKIDEKKDFSYYPNPVLQGNLTIKPSNFSGTLLIKVINITGETIIKKSIYNYQQGDLINLNLNSIATKGCYFISVQDTSKKVIKKVTIQ